MTARLLVNACAALLVASLTGVSCDEVNSALLGETVQINCDSPRGSQPKPRRGSVDWFYERSGTRTPVFLRDASTRALTPAPKFEGRLELDPDQDLTLQGVRLQDQGTFVCVTQEGEMKTLLEIYALPDKVLIQRNPASVVLGQEKQLIGTCISNGIYPEADLTWYKNSQALVNKPAQDVRVDKHVVRESSGLFSVTAHLYYRPTMSDKDASYHCEVQFRQPRGQLGRTKSDDIQILLNYPSQHVNLTVESPLPPIKQGDNVTLKCAVDGTSEPEFTFQKVQNGSVLEDLQIGPKSSITLSAVARNHTGFYRCTVFDFDQLQEDILTAETHVEVNWIEDVTVTVPGNRTLKEGTSLVMECGGRSNKPISVSWTKDGNLLSQSGQLHLSTVDYTHSGAYACEVSVPSVPGLIERRVVPLSVEGMPQVMGSVAVKAPGQLTLVCIAKGNPRPEVTWNVPQTPTVARLGPWEVRSSVALPRGSKRVAATCMARNAHGAVQKALLGPTVPPPVSESPPPSPHASATNTSSKTVIIAILIALLLFFLVFALIFCLCKKYNICFKNRYSPTRKQTKSSVSASPNTYSAPPDQDFKEPTNA